MRGYLELIRPTNCLMSALGCLLGSLVASGSPTILATPIALQAAAIAFLFTGAGNSLNDYYDRDIDSANHPERPIPSGRVSPRGALVSSASLFVAAIVWSPLVRWELVTIVLVNLVLMSTYEMVFKRTGFRGNLLISWLVASLFIFGGLAVYESSDSLVRVSILAVLAFLATLGREITKDIEDIAGDRDRRTLPMVLGPVRAGQVAAACLVTAVGLSALPMLMEVLSLPYAFVVALADAMFIYAALNSARRPRASQRMAKYAMIVALIAFLAGGLP